MDRARTATLYLTISMLLAVCLYGGYTALHPPYSDYEIKASIVDTWQVAAFSTLVLLITVALFAVLSLGLGYWNGDRRTRRLSVVAVFLSISAYGLLLYSHVALTERTMRLTGQSPGGFYGLF
jgi:cytochrome bd-type quinol oxidase subunit 2